jgi:hypothetical protein
MIRRGPALSPPRSQPRHAKGAWRVMIGAGPLHPPRETEARIEADAPLIPRWIRLRLSPGQPDQRQNLLETCIFLVLLRQHPYLMH